MALPNSIQIPQRVTGSFQYQPRPQGKRPAAPTDPFGQLGPAAIQTEVNHFTAGLPKPLTNQQIQGQAQGMLDPVIQKITAAINARAQNAGKAITGYSNSLAQSLAGTDYTAPYRGAEQQQAAVDSSLAQALAGGGLSDANDLQTRLAQIGDPSVAQAAQAVQGNATGNSNAVLAAGSSNLGALIANAASAGGYGAKLPGIARLGGLQDLASANQGAASDIRDQTAQVATQLPGIVNSLRDQSDTRANNISSLAADIYKTLTGQNITKATAKAGLIGDAVKANAPTIVGSSGTGYYSVTPGGQSTPIIPAAPKAAPKPPAGKIIGSDKTGRYFYNPATGTKTLVVPPVKGGATTKKQSPLTASELTKWTRSAQQIATNARNGGTDAKGIEHKPISFEDALGEMRVSGLLADPRVAKLAVKALQDAYGKTETGIAAGAVAGPAAPALP